MLILTEAGEGIGYGHLSRCSAIKDYFDKHGVSSDLLVDLYGLSSSPYPAVQAKKWITDIEQINANNLYSHVLVDSYRLPLERLIDLKKYFQRLIALDDFGRVTEGPDLVINPNIFGDKLAYTSSAVGGRNYIILRYAFRQGSEFKVKDRVKSILITMGGDDIRNLVARIVSLMLNDSDVSVKIVAGTEAYANRLESQFGSVYNRITYYGFVEADVMKSLMIESDLAITACGQTLHELASQGIPTIGICVGDDQILNMKEYVAIGFLSSELYWNSDNLETNIKRNVETLLPKAERYYRSELGKSAIDTEGLKNIFHAIFQ